MTDASDKPFEATPRRVLNARREGNVARSSEFAANLSFAAAGMAVVANAPLLGAAACNALSFSLARRIPAFGSASILAFALISVGCAAAAGSAASILQTGGLTFVGLAPKIERLNPVEGFKRICSRETLAHSVRAALAFTCAALAMAPLIVVGAATLLPAASLD
jgi:flagellar biosynthesis protein FlhB